MKHLCRRFVPALVVPAGVIAALTVAGPAGAHVTANPREAPAASTVVVAFRVGHGCSDGVPTNEVTIKIPDGVYSLKPMVKPGWKIETVVGPLSEPAEAHGEPVTEGVKEVHYTAGQVPDNHFDDFTVRFTTPDKEGETLWFPVTQGCPQGGELSWSEIPVEGQPEPESPAPGLKLVAAPVEAHSADAGQTQYAAAQPVRLPVGEAASGPTSGGGPVGSNTLAVALAGFAVALAGSSVLYASARRR